MKDYRVPITNDDWVAPEETLMDSSSNYSDLEQPISNSVFRFGNLTMAILAMVLVAYAFHMSIVRFDYFYALAYQNKTVNFAISPPRGIIFDYKGDPLVQNLPSFDLLVVSRELSEAVNEREVKAREVARVLGAAEGEFWESLQTNAEKNAVFFAGIDLTKDQVLKIKQNNPAGFYLITSTKRAYLHGQEFSTLVGYTGKVNKKDISDDTYYLPSDTIGRLGLESSYEDVLRGTHGTIFFTDESDEFEKNVDPAPGNNIVLNVRSEMQLQLWKEMNLVLRGAGLTNGAAIVQDPRSGAVLAMASFPSYDNNIFTKELSQDTYARLFESRTRPLFNRVIGGLYNPGSTIKPFIALTALEEKIMGPEDTIQDCVSITIPNPANPGDPYVFKNWRIELGQFNIRRAIANSCNVYFYTVAGGFGNIAGLGINRIADYLKKGLAHIELGIDLPGEKNGFVPTPEWKQKTKKEGWYQGDTYNVSIGQGDLLVTPL
ncbi:MAG: penicillin-binding transpeptidase domain-containing protein, partial [Candidatus Yanofskybacteria bacterium]|nr:penicillin-binding transpeptidase domain-containing protein [Candidatus Yanofskybacteria bacterium]